MPLACPFEQILYQVQPSHFVSIKKVKQGEGTFAHKGGANISSQKEVQDLLTKGDTGSPHKRNV